MIPAAAAIFAAGWCAGSLQFSHPFRWSGFAVTQFWLFMWGLLQQYALQGVVNRRAQEIWGKGVASILFTAALFSALHAPNLWLMGATFLGGLLWASVYQKFPNLYALALSHSIMTTVLLYSFPPSMLRGMRVGYNYF